MLIGNEPKICPGRIVRWRFAICAVAVLALAGSSGCEEQAQMAKKGKQQLDVGDAAPAFSLPGSDGNLHSLADHLGKRAVVIAWFPKAFTGG